jgi:hypothetical protein
MQAYSGEDITQLIRLYKPVSIMASLSTEPVSIPAQCIAYPESRVENIYKMWRNIYRSHQLITHSTDYVARVRYDNGFFQGTATMLKELLAKNRNGLIIPKGGDNRGGIFDMFALGDSESMRVYSALYLFIDQYVMDGIPAHSETLLAHHLHINNINISRVDIPVGLCRQSRPDLIFRGNTLSTGAPELLARMDFETGVYSAE